MAGLFLALAGCGKEEIMPNAAISFFPEGDRVVMSPGEKLELQVRLSPKEKIKELRIEKTALGVTAPFLTLTAFPDTGAVYVLTDQVDIAASDSSTIVYKFWATTTDNKTTVRTHTITVLGIDLHENVKIGAELDTLTGHYYSTKENKVYAPADTAKKYAAAVDFVYFNRAGAADSLAALGATIAAPGSAYAALAYPYDDSVNIAGLPSWSPRNATRFKPATAADFNLPGIYHKPKHTMPPEKSRATFLSYRQLPTALSFLLPPITA